MIFFLGATWYQKGGKLTARKTCFLLGSAVMAASGAEGLDFFEFAKIKELIYMEQYDIKIFLY